MFCIKRERKQRTISQLRKEVARGVQMRRSEEHTSELQSPCNIVCRLLLEKKTPMTWRSKRPRLNIFAQHEMLMVTFRRPQPPAEDIPIYNGRGCTLLELSHGKCRWPISNPGAEDFCFCGNEPVKGLPYCLGHARIAYRSVGRQRSSRRETR